MSSNKHYASNKNYPAVHSCDFVSLGVDLGNMKAVSSARVQTRVAYIETGSASRIECAVNTLKTHSNISSSRVSDHHLLRRDVYMMRKHASLDSQSTRLTF